MAKGLLVTAVVLAFWAWLFISMSSPSTPEFIAKRAARDKWERVYADIGGICLLLMFICATVAALVWGWTA